MGSLEPHIRLGNELGISYALLAGDPKRLDRIAEQLDNIRELCCNREYRSLQGTYQSIKVLALSTGIGGASMAIAVEELAHIGIKAAIRVGSAGSYQPDITLGELIIASSAVRDDGVSKAYVPACYPAAADTKLLCCCTEATENNPAVSHIGMVRSHDSFYTEQENEICAYWSRLGVLGADMETAALYTVGALRGIKALTILNNVVLYQEDAGESIEQYVDGDDLMAAGEKASIALALDTIMRMETKECNTNGSR